MGILSVQCILLAEGCRSAISTGSDNAEQGFDGTIIAQYEQCVRQPEQNIDGQ